MRGDEFREVMREERRQGNRGKDWRKGTELSIEWLAQRNVPYVAFVGFSVGRVDWRGGHEMGILWRFAELRMRRGGREMEFHTREKKRD